MASEYRTIRLTEEMILELKYLLVFGYSPSSIITIGPGYTSKFSLKLISIITYPKQLSSMLILNAPVKTKIIASVSR